MSLQSEMIKQKLWLQIETLPETKLAEVLDFVEFLLHKSTIEKAQSIEYAQQDVLTALAEIRENVLQTYGVYQQDLIAQVRTERTSQLDLGLGIETNDEDSH